MDRDDGVGNADERVRKNDWDAELYLTSMARLETRTAWSVGTRGKIGIETKGLESLVNRALDWRGSLRSGMCAAAFYLLCRCYDIQIDRRTFEFISRVIYLFQLLKPPVMFPEYLQLISRNENL